MTDTLSLPARTSARYPNTQLVRDAVAQHLGTYGLGDGGYEDDWVKVKIGYLPVVFPNTAGRKKAVRVHDLHHVAGSFDASWKQGELEVSAWELGSGGPGPFLLGWAIVTGGLLGGLALCPRDTYRAFLRGRRSKNLFGTEVLPEHYEQTVGELRERLSASPEPPVATLADRLSFLAWVAVGLGIHLVGLALAVGALGVAAAWIASRWS